MANEKLKTITLDTTSMDAGGGLEHLLDGNADGSLRSNTSTAEGSTYSLGQGAVAVGLNTKAIGQYSHAEGYETSAAYSATHAEGSSTTASAFASHAEGSGTTASSDSSHAEGNGGTASGLYSHAEGRNSRASGSYSHAQNEWTLAKGFAQTTIGRFNKEQGRVDTLSDTDQAFIIGNGTSSSTADRSNAMYVTWGGDMWLAGGIILKSPNGTEYKLGVDNNGQLTITAV